MKNAQVIAFVDHDEVFELLAARARLAAARQRSRRHKDISAYYGDGAQREEIISTAGVPEAVVTRNHYGSLVLNASRALFIDVDFQPLSRTSPQVDAPGGEPEEPWRWMFDDLCTVLSAEREEAFRIYRTAAGFRILATTRPFEPGSAASQRLMNAVGADDAFIRLCRVQRSFRARLTPKPWRCGSTQPPNAYPRPSADEQQQFTNWLSRYERACRDRATCQYLGHVGPEITHERVAPVVELHDGASRAFEPLPLA